MNTVIRNDKNEIIGYLSEGGCTNPACKRAIKQGRKVHAIPMHWKVENDQVVEQYSYILLDDYHFHDEHEAIAMLHEAHKQAENNLRTAKRSDGNPVVFFFKREAK